MEILIDFLHDLVKTILRKLTERDQKPPCPVCGTPDHEPGECPAFGQMLTPGKKQ